MQVVQLMLEWPDIDLSEGHLVYSVVRDMDGVSRDGAQWELLQETLDKLIEARAPVTQAGPEGYHPLDLAVCLGDEDLVDLLELVGDVKMGFPVHAAMSQLSQLQPTTDGPVPGAINSTLQ